MTAEQGELDPGHVYFLANGLVHTSVCAPVTMTPEQVAAAANRESPTGIASAWQVSGQPFDEGTPNPCPCDQEPEGRRHWLLEC